MKTELYVRCKLKLVNNQVEQQALCVYVSMALAWIKTL